MKKHHTIIHDGRRWYARPFDEADIRIAQDHLHAASRGGYSQSDVERARERLYEARRGVRLGHYKLVPHAEGE